MNMSLRPCRHDKITRPKRRLDQETREFVVKCSCGRKIRSRSVINSTSEWNRKHAIAEIGVKNK